MDSDSLFTLGIGSTVDKGWTFPATPSVLFFLSLRASFMEAMHKYNYLLPRNKEYFERNSAPVPLSRQSGGGGGGGGGRRRKTNYRTA